MTLHLLILFSVIGVVAGWLADILEVVWLKCFDPN